MKTTLHRFQGLNTPVQFIKGVGPRLGAIFSRHEIYTVKDLLTFFPRAYEDRTRLLRVDELKEGQSASVSVQVVSKRQIPNRRSGSSILEVRCSDGSGTLLLKWFHAPRGMESRFTPGIQFIVTGVVKFYLGRLEIIHPEITWNVSSEAVGRIVPIYVEIEGIPSRQLRKVLWEALQKYSKELTEDLPQRYLEIYGFPAISEATYKIHFPEECQIQELLKFNSPAHWRLIYEEFFKFEYLVLKKKLRVQMESASAMDPIVSRGVADDFIRLLPFKLTSDQKKVIDEVLKDLSQLHPMNRLLQGDVGSGKTAIAWITAAVVLAQGGQGALMAPTEILAEQHFKNAIQFFQGRLNVALLTGKTSQSERHRLQTRLASGKPLLLIGTHALLEEPVVFNNLLYIMIDEQHRFGVEQRRTLRLKGMYLGRYPHSLILTATPIPRTLALTVYGDLSISTLRELPPGRSPITTQVIRGNARVSSYEKVRDELQKGRQAYFIYPLINESEAEGFTSLKAAISEAERLKKEVFPEFKLELLHGQMRSDEKISVMERFKANEFQILVSTTVVEVGVDVPNATVMAVEHADRFGLSQLHQLRGRVGRGSHPSYCFLFAARRIGESTAQRLEVLEDTYDGFKIAEADLEIRGPGEFLGTRQAGDLPFKMAHLVRDQKWLLKARDDVLTLLKEDPDLVLPQNQSLRLYYEREGSLQLERLQV